MQLRERASVQAPASSARSILGASEEISTSTVVSDRSSTIRRVDSTASSPGIERSISTTSGCSAEASAIASCPQLAQPTSSAPAVLVVGGSIARAWELIAPELERRLPSVAVSRAARLDDAALLGAAF